MRSVALCLASMAVVALLAVAYKKYVVKNGKQFHRVENTHTQSEIELQTTTEASMRV